MSEPERLDEVGRWLGYAGEDLRAARALMKLEDMPRQVCFHAQQASEKAIKSIFVFLQTEFPYTHDLDRLRGLLPEGWLAEEELPDLSGLTFWATRGRYPGSPRAAAEDGLDGLAARRIEGFCNRATHNLWVLLEEARWVEDRLASGTYREDYEDRLDNSIYKPLIAKAVEASVRTFGNAN